MYKKLTDIQKKNVLEDLETGELEFSPVGDFIAELNKKFSKENNKLAKVVKLKRVEQESKMMEKQCKSLKEQ